MPGDDAKQRASEAVTLIKQAAAIAQQGNYGAALKAIARAEQIVHSALQQPELSNPKEIWLEAKEQIDEQINKLQVALRTFTDPRLDRIAELGVYGLLEQPQVPLMAALLDFERTPPSARLGPPRDKVLKAIGVMAKAIAQDPIIDLCEKNPFGVSISIRSTVARALGQIKTQLTETG
jgi:hypothetical protein